MQRTFLVTLDLDDSDDPRMIAADIMESLNADSFHIISVEPWQQHGDNSSPISAFDIPV